MLLVPRRLASLAVASALLVSCSGGAADGEIAITETITTAPFVFEVGQRRPWDGMILPPDTGQQYESTSILADLAELAELGAPNVSLVVPVRLDPLTGLPQPVPGSTPSDDALVEVMELVGQLGLGVVLQLRLETAEGPAIGVSVDRDAWFEAYRRLAVHYAGLAARHDASLFVLGGGVDDRLLQATAWSGIIDDVREVYPGPVSFSVDAEHLERVPFWDDVDVIGVETTFPTPDVAEPISADIEKAWEPVMQELSLLAETWSRPVVLTRVGYPGVGGTTTGPLGIAEARQLGAYEALFTVANQTPAIDGILMWRWGTDPLASGGEEATYSPEDRLAEDVLRRSWTTPLAGEDDVDLGAAPGT